VPECGFDRMRLAWFFTLCVPLVASHGVAAETRVASLQELRRAISNASPGDEIVVADGKYSCEEAIDISAAGMPSLPIKISAATVGGAEITDTAGFRFRSSAAHVILSGFNFTHKAGTLSLPAGSHHCRVTRNRFELEVANAGAYLSISGDNHEVDHNTFENKDTEGPMLIVQGPAGRAMAQRTWIHHNFFRNFANSGRNNSSALHIGHSSRSLSPAHSIVEYNLFSKTEGENEGAICNKSCDNIYRFNTFAEGCTELSLRHGNRCLVYGNFFIGTRGGLRFFGDDHRIYSNYFQANDPAVQIGNGSANVPPAELTSHDRPDRVQFVFNTLVDNRSNIVMRGRSGGIGATELTIANNLIQGGKSAAAIAGPLPRAIWEGNVVWDTDPGDIPKLGYGFYDPKLLKAANGILTPERGSRVIGSATGSHPYVDVDVKGQRRAKIMDVGAHQYPERTAINDVATPSDVGPSAP
jgi:poly(beta-D-mannuronate) lyase